MKLALAIIVCICLYLCAICAVSAEKTPEQIQKEFDRFCEIASLSVLREDGLKGNLVEESRDILEYLGINSKKECVAALELECGKSGQWVITDQFTQTTAYNIFKGKIKNSFEAEFCWFLRIASRLIVGKNGLKSDLVEESRDILKYVDDNFKKECVAGLELEYGSSSQWDINDQIIQISAHNILEGKIGILVEEEFETFIRIAYSSDMRYYNRKFRFFRWWSGFEKANVDFKKKCVAALQSKYKESISSLYKNKKGKETRDAAYVALEDQLMSFVDNLDFSGISLPDGFISDLKQSNDIFDFAEFFEKWFEIKKKHSDWPNNSITINTVLALRYYKR